MNRFNQIVAIIIFCVSLAACTSTGPKEKPEVKEEVPPNVVGTEVTYNTDSTELKGYIAYDDTKEGKRPGILVVHEWWGHNEYTRKRADMLAEMGYTAIAVDMYGDGKQAAHPDDAGKFAGQVFSNLDEAKERFTQAIETLKQHETVDQESISAIGYCFGGSVVLSMANAGYDLDLVAAFHAGLQLPIRPDSTMTARVLVCNGAADPFISPESVTQFKAAMDAANADYRYVAYDSAVHAFTNPGADSLGEKFGLPLAYDQSADEASWAELELMLQSVYD